MSRLNFPNGSVGANLLALRGTWHDRVELFELDGTPLCNDLHAGSAGASPFENLVYIDFDGVQMQQTNVTFRGRETSAKTFSGTMKNGVLVFDSLGDGAYENIGMSGGPGVLIYSGRETDRAWNSYFEPDVITQTDHNHRNRYTVLYRFGKAQRLLTATGERLSDHCQERHPWDPRGSEGPVHGAKFQTNLWQNA